MIDINNLETINSLYEFYRETSNFFSTNTFNGVDLNYQDAFELVKRRAGYLQSKGYKKGDIVGILALNSDNWLISYMALTSIGIIALPLDTNLETESYNTMLNQVNAKGIYCDDITLELTDVEILDINYTEPQDSINNFKEEELDNTDLATLLYTSGTTGKPKIVQLTHGNMYKASINGNNFVKVKPGSLVLCMLPFYHIFGLHSTFLATFGVGSGYICQPSLTAPAILQSLKDHEINVFPAVPKLWEMMLDGMLNKVKNASKIKYGIFMFNLKYAHILKGIGLGFIPKAIFKPVHKVFGEKIDFLITGGASLKKEYYNYYYNMGFKIMEGYGLTETTSAICASDRNKYKPSQCGRPLPGNQMEIRKQNSSEIGEIWFKGAHVFPGYYKNPEATAEVIDENGWFYSGDLGFADKYGELHITGREKNLIVLPSGKNVYPEELESYYMDSPLVGEIAVFGKIIDGEESVYGVIVPSNLSLSYKDLEEEINKVNMGRPTYKILSSFALSYEPLPKTTKRTNINSKIKENLELGIYNTGGDQKANKKLIEPADENRQAILNVLLDELKQKHIYHGQTLSDFKVDSLGTMNLIIQLEEKLSIKIEEATFTSITDIEALISYLSTCEKGSGRSSFNELISGKIITKSVSYFNPIFELLLYIFRLLSKLFWKVKVYKKENLNFENTIVAVNHQSILDILILLSSISYKVRKNMFFTAKKELKFLKFLFPGISYIFVDRKNNALPALKAGADILRQGKTLVIFPEGTRTKDGKLSEFKTGAAFLAKELKKSIIPMAIKGAHKIMPTNSFFPKFITKERISLTILKKIKPENYINKEKLNSALFASIKYELAKKS